MTETGPLLECDALNISIGGKAITRQLTLRILPGECWCILGPNGSGKTTLLHTLAGLRAPQSGQIYLDGTNIHQLSRRQLALRAGILFQHQQDSFPASVLETVLQGRHPHLRPWQWETADDRNIAREALHALELENFAQRDIRTLSGGERQRVAIATLLAQQTPLNLLDEPSNHLDLGHRIKLLNSLVRDTRLRGRGVCMSLHDINLAARFADHALLLHGNGEFDLGPVATVLVRDKLETLYGLPLRPVRLENRTFWIPV
jgi:iron complex transport system ATP-binding protein